MEKLVSLVSAILGGIWKFLCWCCNVWHPQYKTRFWRVLWSIIGVCVVGVSGLLGYACYEHLQNENRERSYWIKHLSRNVYYYDGYGHQHYVKVNGKKVLEDLDWLTIPERKDSTEYAVFAKQGYRGYINMNTGKVLIDANKYTMAWIFGGDLAAVAETDTLLFIDKSGKEFFRDMGLVAHNQTWRSSNVFKNGLMAAKSRETDKWGIFRNDGTWALTPEYDDVCTYHDTGWYVLQKDGKATFLDSYLNQLLSGEYKSIDAYDDTHIYVQLMNNVCQQLDIQGNVLEDFLIEDVEDLTYKTEDMETYMIHTTNDEGETTEEHCREQQEAVAKYKKYSTPKGDCGLMTRDGKIITLPKYGYIEAIGYDTYIGSVDGGNRVVVKTN